MRPIRRQLLLLTIGLLLPTVLFGSFVVWQLSIEQRAAGERRLIQSARDLAGTLDRELSGSVRSLQALAQSQTLDQRDLVLFRRTALRVLDTQPTWMGIILLSPDGQMLVNTSTPEGEPLGQVIEPESLRQVIETEKPTVGSVAKGKLRQQLAFPVRVPVTRDDKLEYILTAVIEPAALVGLVGSTNTDEWTRTIVDSNGTVVARSREPEKFIGTPATPSFHHQTRVATEGIFPETTLDGASAYVAFARARLPDWVTVVVVPTRIIDGPQRQWLASMIGIGVAVLLVSTSAAMIFARRISKSLQGAALAAEQLATGGRPYVRPSSIAEVARLRSALRRSSLLLSRRERERNDSLARAEAARTEADNARAVAERANAAKDQFLAVLSHELRTPLTPAMATVQMLESDPSLPSEVHDALSMIRRNVQLEVTLIDDLLDLTRIARGKIELQLQEINLRTKLQHIVDICREDVSQKRQQLVQDLPSQSPVAIADPARLQQVLWNLVKNAVKFTPEGGTITVLACERADDNVVEVRVTDTGIGIDPSAIDKIFNAFEQGGAGVTRQFGGLGLGLTISRTMAEMMGGSLAAESEGVDKGATFILTLPCAVKTRRVDDSADDAAAETNSATVQNTTTPPTVNRLEGVRVLLVEDNTDTARAMSRLLGTFGCTVRVADSVAAATTAAAEERFDLVLSDLGLPDGTGYELMQQLRAQYGLNGVAISGFGMEDDIRKSVEAGFSDHITKPVDIHRLKQVIERVATLN